jgi:hypothetical protein
VPQPDVSATNGGLTPAAGSLGLHTMARSDGIAGRTSRRVSGAQADEAERKRVVVGTSPIQCDSGRRSSSR